MSLIGTFDCPMCGTHLEWEKRLGRLAGLKAHWDVLHRPAITWLGFLGRCQVED